MCGYESQASGGSGGTGKVHPLSQLLSHSARAGDRTRYDGRFRDRLRLRSGGVRILPDSRWPLEHAPPRRDGAAAAHRSDVRHIGSRICEDLGGVFGGVAVRRSGVCALLRGWNDRHRRYCTGQRNYRDRTGSHYGLGRLLRSRVRRRTSRRQFASGGLLFAAVERAVLRFRRGYGRRSAVPRSLCRSISRERGEFACGAVWRYRDRGAGALPGVRTPSLVRRPTPGDFEQRGRTEGSAGDGSRALHSWCHRTLRTHGPPFDDGYSSRNSGRIRRDQRGLAPIDRS